MESIYIENKSDYIVSFGRILSRLLFVGMFLELNCGREKLVTALSFIFHFIIIYLDCVF